MSKEKWNDIKAKVEEETDRWQADHRTFMVIVNDGQRMAATYGGDYLFLANMIVRMMNKDPRVAVACKRAVEVFEKTYLIGKSLS